MYLFWIFFFTSSFWFFSLYCIGWRHPHQRLDVWIQEKRMHWWKLGSVGQLLIVSDMLTPTTATAPSPPGYTGKNYTSGLTTEDFLEWKPDWNVFISSCLFSERIMKKTGSHRLYILLNAGFRGVLLMDWRTTASTLFKYSKLRWCWKEKVVPIVLFRTDITLKYAPYLFLWRALVLFRVSNCWFMTLDEWNSSSVTGILVFKSSNTFLSSCLVNYNVPCQLM